MKEISLTGSLLFLLNCVNQLFSLLLFGLFLYICYTILKDLFASSTVMEGSFGNQKQHYNVGRIAARNSRSETLLLFFGIQCANAAILAARQLAIEEKRKQRRKRRA